MLPLQNLHGLPFLSAIPSAARNNQPFWFVAMLILNTLGVIELVYLLGFRKDKQVYGAKSEVVASEASGA